MELGKQWARITDYGVTKTKAGVEQVYISFQVGTESSTWYGMPYKKDSSDPNDMCMMQLATCGFDSGIHTIRDLYKGPVSGVLITDEDIDVTIKDYVVGDGSTKRRIDSIGDFGPTRIDASEIELLVTDEKVQKLKATAGRYKVRQRKEKKDIKGSDPMTEIPF